VATDLTGFMFDVWVDDHGYSGTHPGRGSSINATSTPNGKVDLWDTHIQYTVGSSSVTYVTITYAPDSSGMHPTTSAPTTISGSATDPYGRTVAQIQQNIANWYQYYRRRSFMAKGAIASILNNAPNFRYGYTTINYPTSGTPFIEMPPSGVTSFASYNTAILTNMFSYNWPNYSTPLRKGLDNVGKYYSGTLSGHTTSPIISACQKNFTILLTDGFWNDSFSSSTIANADGDPYSNTLADVAYYYYKTDLRSSVANIVPPDPYDSANWQHMVTFGVAFGEEGNLVDTDGDGWPNPVLGISSNWGNPTSSAAIIDDTWHAAFNSKGRYASAKNPRQVDDFLTNTLQDITNRSSSMAAISLNSGSISTLTMLYQAQFNTTSWEGYLYGMSVNNGAVGSQVWEAGALLPAYTSRVILTSSGAAGIPFEWSSLIGAQQTALNTNSSGVVDGRGAQRLNYLRGDNSLEAGRGGSFRDRINTKLGDIVDSSPQYASNENFGYADSFQSAPYSTYVAGIKTTRRAMVYAGADDGMLHGFDAVTGVETMAYVPNTLFSNLSQLTSPSYTHLFYVNGTPTIGDAFFGGAWHNVLVGGLNEGGQAIYALDVTDPSHFTESNASSLVLWEFTDSSDADLGYTFSRPNVVKMANGTWAAVFGNGYNNTKADGRASATGDAVLYIVNIQTGALIAKIDTMVGSSRDPTGMSRNNGLSTATPVDVNQDGIADYIYAGDLFGNVWKFDVTSATPSSWRVAFTASGSPAPLFTACAAATCSSTNHQPITDRVTVGLGPNKQGYMVYFGTGKYLESTDLSDMSKQSLYGIWDKNDGITTVSGRSALLQQTILYEGTYTLQDGTTSSSSLRVTSTNDYSSSPPTTQLGWYMDLTSPVSGAQGERVVDQPTLRNGRIIFITIIPTTNPCNGGGGSWVMEMNALNGSQLTQSPFDLNNDGRFDSNEYVQVTINGTAQWVPVSGVNSAQLLTTPAIAVDTTSTPNTETKFMSGSSGAIVTVTENPGSSASGRQSWRQMK